jgi:hypothetical protein
MLDIELSMMLLLHYFLGFLYCLVCLLSKTVKSHILVLRRSCPPLQAHRDAKYTFDETLDATGIGTVCGIAIAIGDSCLI